MRRRDPQILLVDARQPIPIPRRGTPTTSDTQTSSRRAQANRRNAQRSCGPKCTEKTRFNALRHGLRAKSPILPGEDAQALRARHEAFSASIEPVDEVERLLVERLVKISWRLDRVDR